MQIDTTRCDGSIVLAVRGTEWRAEVGPAADGVRAVEITHRGERVGDRGPVEAEGAVEVAEALLRRYAAAVD